jgi:uncharacterized membrane protein (UPF0136 family)
MEFSTAFIVAQIVGLICAGITAASVQMKRRRDIILLIMISGAAYSVAAWLMGAYSGMVMNATGVFLALIAYIYSRRNKPTPKPVLVIYEIVVIVVWSFLYNGWVDVLTLAAQTLFLFEMMVRKENVLRVFVMMNTACWLVYNAIFQLYTPIIGNVVLLGSDTVALIRYHKHKRRSRQHGKT